MSEPRIQESVAASTVGARASDGVRQIAPGYFAFVMATGIISIATYGRGWEITSQFLAVVAGIAWVVLVGMNLLRLGIFRTAMSDDLHDPTRAFGFFTFVAGTCVLGSRIAMEDWYLAAFSLLILGSVSWLLLGYVIPWTAVLGRAARPVLQTANGTWFIWVVASQSIAVLAATLEVELPSFRKELAILAVFSWSVGIFLYAAAGVFVGARMLMYELRPIDLTPPYWVAMGATAITVVAGARIVQMADAPMVDATRGLIAGASVFFWAFGTWLIPPLLAAGYWRHYRHNIPLRYESALWSVVFPLGMYGVGSSFLGEANHLPIVATIGYWQVWVALAAWTVTAVAMAFHVGSSLTGHDQSRGQATPP